MKWFIALVAICCLALGALAFAQRADADQAQVALRAAMQKEMVDGDIAAAIAQYQQIVDRYSRTNRAAAATALLEIGRAYEMLGDTESQKAYDRLVREFSDQKDVADTARAPDVAPRSRHRTRCRRAHRVKGTGRGRGIV